MQVLVFLIVNKARFVIEIVDTKYELGLPEKAQKQSSQLKEVDGLKSQK